MDTSSDGGTDSLQECDERPRIVRDELPAVTRGSFPSLDYVHCPVPWHFEHATADQGRRALFARRSKVMRRHDEAEVKHAFLGCDV